MERSFRKLDWPKAAVVQLVEEWPKYEVLYNIYHSLYHNKHARHDALQKIAQLLQANFPGFQLDAKDVKVKMTYLRGQYCREIAKEAESNKNGTIIDSKYESSAYWFAGMHFLRDFVRMRKEQSNFVCPSETSQDSIEMKFEADEYLVDEIVPPPTKKQRPSSDAPAASKTLDSSEEALRAATFALQSISTLSEINSVDDSFVRYIKEEMASIRNNQLRIELREEILGLIFETKRKDRIECDPLIE